MVNVRVRCSDFSKLPVHAVHSIDVRHLCLASIAQFATDMENVENVEEMVGTRKAEAAAVATESGGAVATESGGAVATESGGVATRWWRRLVTRRQRPVG